MKVEVLKRLISINKREYLKYALLLVVLMIPSIDFLFHILVLYFFGSLLYIRYDYDKSWKFILKAPILSIAFIRLVMYSFPKYGYDYGEILLILLVLFMFVQGPLYGISRDLSKVLCNKCYMYSGFDWDSSCNVYITPKNDASNIFLSYICLFFICIFLFLWLKHKSIKYILLHHVWIFYLFIPPFLRVVFGMKFYFTIMD